MQSFVSGGDAEVAISVVDVEATVNAALFVAAELSCVLALCEMLLAMG